MHPLPSLSRPENTAFTRLALGRLPADRRASLKALLDMPASSGVKVLKMSFIARRASLGVLGNMTGESPKRTFDIICLLPLDIARSAGFTFFTSTAGVGSSVSAMHTSVSMVSAT